MKRNLLDYTQSILSAMGGDNVNSITDTVESTQVAEILRSKYYDILGRAELPEHDKLFQLEASGNIKQPTLMFRPNEGVSKINWVQYFNTSTGNLNESSFDHGINTDIETSEENLEETFGPTANVPAFEPVQILPTEQFLAMVNQFDTSQSNVGTMIWTDFLTNSEVPDTFQINYRNDKQPQYCTIIQNFYFLFDSYDDTQDSTLQTQKTMVSGFITPNWVMSDTFVPDLDDWAVPLLYNEAKAQAFYEIKQTINPHAEREIDRQWVSLQKTKAVVNKPSWFDQLPNFGRRRWWP